MENKELRQSLRAFHFVRGRQFKEMLEREEGVSSLSPEYAVYLRSCHPTLFLALLSKRERRKSRHRFHFEMTAEEFKAVS